MATASRFWITLCLIATCLIWGSTYLAVKFALVSFPPFLQMGSRFIVAGILVSAWARCSWPVPMLIVLFSLWFCVKTDALELSGIGVGFVGVLLLLWGTSRRNMRS